MDDLRSRALKFARIESLALAAYDKWSEKPLLESLLESPLMSKSQVALILENQRNHNMTHGDDRFKRLSIPLLVRLTRNVNSKNIVGASERGTKFVKIPVSFNYNDLSDVRFVNGLDAEAEMCFLISEMISSEVSRLGSVRIHHIEYSESESGPEVFCPRHNLVLCYEQV